MSYIKIYSKSGGHAPGGGNATYVPYGDVPRSGYTFWPSNPRQGVFFRA